MKKLLALFLALVMCLGVFAACGDDEPSGDGDATKDNTSTEEKTEE